MVYENCIRPFQYVADGNLTFNYIAEKDQATADDPSGISPAKRCHCFMQDVPPARLYK